MKENHTVKVGVANLYLMRASQCPAALIEISNLANEEDIQTLSGSEGQQQIANAIAGAIDATIAAL